MSCRPWPLENYDARGPGPGSPAASTTSAALETSLDEVRLAAFDKGYQDGWEDADRAHQQDQGRIAAELAHNLQALSFTYHEARQATMKDTELLFRGMIESVLPKVLPAALTATVLDRLMDGLEAATQPMVEITVAPDNVARLEEMIGDSVAPPHRICPEPSLGSGQAFLRFEDREERVDLQEILTELETIVEDLFAPGSMQEDQRDAG